MTRTDRLLLTLLILPCALLSGCVEGIPGDKRPGGTGHDDVETFAEPKNRRESVDIVRESPVGPIIVSYASAPMTADAPPDGVRGAVLRAVGNEPLSAAAFHWKERDLAMDWIRGQMEERRRRGWQPRVILAGHGLGATEASETARDLLFEERDFAVALLLTVDAVKSSRYGGAAYAAGNAIVNRLPGVSHSFTAYDAAPAPDGRRVWAHINYYQNKSATLHGAAMPHAENHLLSDWTGVLNHGNADDYALPNLTGDLKHAITLSQRGQSR